MEDCIFCKLIRKEAPALIVEETEDTLGFLELNPSSPGHSMVIHKKHGYSILDYTEDELGKIMTTVQILAKKIRKALNTDWISIGINHHEAKGVPHLHIHLIPRWNNDDGGTLQSIVKNITKETREEIAEKIRKAL